MASASHLKTLINYLCLILILTSCAGKARIEARHCRASMGTWDVPDRLDFYIEQKVWTQSSINGDVSPVRLVEVLRENGIECEKIKRMNMTITRTWSDVFLSFIPFSSRATLTLEGTFLSANEMKKMKGPMKDDGSTSKDGDTR